MHSSGCEQLGTYCLIESHACYRALVCSCKIYGIDHVRFHNLCIRPAHLEDHIFTFKVLLKHAATAKLHGLPQHSNFDAAYGKCTQLQPQSSCRQECVQQTTAHT